MGTHTCYLLVRDDGPLKPEQNSLFSSDILGDDIIIALEIKPVHHQVQTPARYAPSHPKMMGLERAVVSKLMVQHCREKKAYNR